MINHMHHDTYLIIIHPVNQAEEEEGLYESHG